MTTNTVKLTTLAQLDDAAQPLASKGFGNRGCQQVGARQVSAGGIRWQVKTSEPSAADKPRLLLLHGTGAGIHSWSGLWPLLEDQFTLFAPDLPGHCQSRAPPNWRPSLDAMAAALTALLSAEQFQPDLVVGHSAGAALAARMTLDQSIAPRAVVAINGAFMPYGGPAAALLMPIARWCAGSGSITGRLAKRASEPGAVERLLEQTGSAVTAEAVERYQRHLRNPDHISGTLRMMANWDLRSLLRQLRLLSKPLYLLVGDKDTTVPPRQAHQLARRMALAGTHFLPGLGHLAHEEQPQSVADLLLSIAARHGLTTDIRES